MSAATLQLIFLFKEGREIRDEKSRARKKSSAFVLQLLSKFKEAE
jgi:hypothetical protein